MSTSLLGPLPQFSQSKSTKSKNNSLQLDSELDSLLNDVTVQPDHHNAGFGAGKYKGKSSTLPTGFKLSDDGGMTTAKKTSLKSSKPKSQFAPEPEGPSRSPDISVSEEDKAKIVGSIKDIDDMESNLFHSLNKTQPKRSLGQAKKVKAANVQQRKPQQPKKVSFEAEEFDEQEQELMREINKGLAASKPAKSISPSSKHKSLEAITKSSTKKLGDDDVDVDVDDDDDDIFADLLLDSEEDDADLHKKAKPKLKLVSNTTAPPASSADNINDGMTESVQTSTVTMDTKQRPTNVAAPKASHDSNDEFGGDDILGLIDTPQKPSAMKASRFDELLGRKHPQDEKQQSPQEEKQSALNVNHSLSTSSIGLVSNDENASGDVQFGGYLPSAMSSGGSRKTKGLLQNTRRSMSDSVERPSTAPTKKSVRFSNSAIDSVRPSSTPFSQEHSRQEVGANPIHQATDTLLTTGLKDSPLETSLSTVGTTVVKEKSSRQLTAQANNKLFGANDDHLLIERPPTGRRRQQVVPDQQESVSKNLFESSDSTTLLPSSKPHSSAPPSTTHQSALQPMKHTETQSVVSATASSIPQSAGSHDPIVQQQLTQQQSLIQQQFIQLQQMTGELATSKMQLEQARIEGERNGTQVKEQLQKELVTIRNQVKQLQEELQEEKTASSKLKMEIVEVEKRLKVSEEEKVATLKQYEATQQESRQLSEDYRKEMASNTLAVDDLKMKLHRAELERDQLQHTLQLCQQRHSDEIQSIEKSHSVRVTTIEEAHQRREKRWREEQELEVTRQSERLQQLEREKLDSVMAVRKKLEAHEISKSNEIEKLQALHRSSVSDLHREHDLEIQHLKTVHEQEMAALKAAFSHTRALTDLTRQVEASSREVSSLQQRVDKAHNLGLGQRQEVLKCREEQLKANERRLVEQQAENEAERVRLQTLISRMESSISDQTRQLEQERWKLQQDSVRLNAQQSAFDQDRTSFTARMEQERADLQAAKDKFLAEQREMMSKCYEERREVANELSRLSSSQKLSKEKEVQEAERLRKSERTLKLQLERLQEESSKLVGERAQLSEEQERQDGQLRALQEKEKAITEQESEASKKLQQAKEMHEMATKMYQQGQQSLEEARLLKGTAESQLASVQSQQIGLQKQEKHLTQERLNVARERKEQIQATVNPTGIQTIDNVINDDVISDDVILPYMSQSAPQPTRSHMATLLDQLDTNIQLRRLAVEAEQDSEYLEEEKNFLASLRSSGRLTLMELENSYS